MEYGQYYICLASIKIAIKYHNCNTALDLLEDMIKEINDDDYVNFKINFIEKSGSLF